MQELWTDKKTTGRQNQQFNAILEIKHKVLGNYPRTFELNKIDLDEEHPWDELLSAATYTVLSNTMHTTLGTSPGKLVFII